MPGSSLGLLPAPSKSVPFATRLAEAAAWCHPSAERADPGRLPAVGRLRPRLLGTDWTAAVRGGVQQLSCTVARRVPPGAPADGRLLAGAPDATLSDGAAGVESRGYFDADNTPPWDTWIGLRASAGTGGAPTDEVIVRGVRYCNTNLDLLPMQTTTADRNAAPKPETARRSKPRQLGLRISDVARKQLEQIADFHGLNLTHALEYAIRATARQDGIAPGGPIHRAPRQ